MKAVPWWVMLVAVVVVIAATTVLLLAGKTEPGWFRDVALVLVGGAAGNALPTKGGEPK